MASTVPDRADYPKPDWKSAWPVGHANYHEYVSPIQQETNLLRQNPTKFHELRKNNGVPDLQVEKPVDWRSPFPKGHPNYRAYVSPEQQTRNARGY